MRAPRLPLDNQRGEPWTTTPGRRGFLKRASQLTAVVGGLAALPGSIQRALAIPAARVRGTIQDVQHVVILMRENRSFDHYFGTMSGVRGFADRTAIPTPSGKPVWYESDGTRDVLPFHLDTQRSTAMRVPGTPTQEGQPWSRRFAGRLETGRHGVTDPAL